MASAAPDAGVRKGLVIQRPRSPSASNATAAPIASQPSAATPTPRSTRRRITIAIAAPYTAIATAKATSRLSN